LKELSAKGRSAFGREEKERESINTTDSDRINVKDHPGIYASYKG
jgi:hypothetical protein